MSKSLKATVVYAVLLLCSALSVSAQNRQSPEIISYPALLQRINAGVTLEKQGRNSAALVEFEKAETIAPAHPLVLFNLGQAYQLAGRNADALKKYQKYLSLYPKGSQVPLISNLVKVMNTQLLMSGFRSSAGQDNYLNEAFPQGAYCWKARQMPVAVYIAAGDGVDGFKPEYSAILRDAFNEWVAATEGALSVSFQSSPEKALIKCRWTANAKELANPAEGGQALLLGTTQGDALSADMLICTKPSCFSASLPAEKFIKHVCLHEAGHALGLPGHSSDPHDLMFSIVNLESVNLSLSERDKKTIKALYCGVKQ